MTISVIVLVFFAQSWANGSEWVGFKIVSVRGSGVGRFVPSLYSTGQSEYFQTEADRRSCG